MVAVAEESPKPDSTAAAATDEVPEMTREEKLKKAQDLFASGKRHLLSGNLPDASSNLAESCELYVDVYGTFAAECFEPHFSYGKTLLELGRIEPGVFTNALQGVEGDVEDSSVDGEDEPESTEADQEGEEKKGEEETEKKETEKDDQFEDASKLTEEEREELHEQVEDALDENAECLEQGKDPAKETETNGQTDDGQQETEAAEEPESTEGGEQEPETTEENQEPEELSNLQLAWETLDVARIICTKQEGEEWKLRLVDVLMSLSEASIEDERYDKAQEDLEQCLAMQKELLPADDRRTAECHFQLGRLFNLTAKYTDAAGQFGSALVVLNDRLSGYVEELASADEGAKAKIEKEIANVEGLLPDIQAKIDDCLESQKTADQKKSEEQKQEGETTGFDKTEADKGAATDISSLVRKPIKRKDENEGDVGEAKRAKAENGEAVNGNKSTEVA